MSNEKSLDCIGKCINTRDCGDCNDKDLYCEGITMYSEEAYMQIKQQLEKSEKINFELAASCCDRVLIGDGGHPYCDLKQQLADEKKKVKKMRNYYNCQHNCFDTDDCISSRYFKCEKWELFQELENE